MLMLTPATTAQGDQEFKAWHLGSTFTTWHSISKTKQTNKKQLTKTNILKSVFPGPSPTLECGSSQVTQFPSGIQSGLTVISAQACLLCLNQYPWELCKSSF